MDEPVFTWDSEVLAAHPPRKEIVLAITAPDGADAWLSMPYSSARYLRDCLTDLMKESADGAR
jgi:hypothetical protein